MYTVLNSGLQVRSKIVAGNNRSDKCYSNRNLDNLNPKCWISKIGCPTDDDLKSCLAVSGEPNWWKDFPGMTQESACALTNRMPIADWQKKQMGC